MRLPNAQLSLADAAVQLGMSYFTIRRMIQDGRLGGGQAKVAATLVYNSPCRFRFPPARLTPRAANGPI